MIRVRTEGRIAFVELARLDKKNALTGEMYGQLADAISAADKDPQVRVVLLHGAPDCFCAGNDVGDFLKRPPLVEGSPSARFFVAMQELRKPMVAAVGGPAVGIGTTMLLHCDMVYAGDNAVFSLPFVNLGICPEAGSSLLLAQMIGFHRAAEILLLGEPFKADAALDMGLVNRIVPAAEANALAQAQARKVAAKPMSSLLETKRLMKKAQSSLVALQMADEGATFARMLNEPAAREALSAFMEKRKPDFSRM